MTYSLLYYTFFFFNDTATTEIYTLSLHDALPIFKIPFTEHLGVELVEMTKEHAVVSLRKRPELKQLGRDSRRGDRKSTRLNSSPTMSSYSVFCFEKKKKKEACDQGSLAYTA